jgi:hypothetical protein
MFVIYFVSVNFLAASEKSENFASNNAANEYLKIHFDQHSYPQMRKSRDAANLNVQVPNGFDNHMDDFNSESIKSDGYNLSNAPEIQRKRRQNDESQQTGSNEGNVGDRPRGERPRGPPHHRGPCGGNRPPPPSSSEPEVQGSDIMNNDGNSQQR